MFQHPLFDLRRLPGRLGRKQVGIGVPLDLFKCITQLGLMHPSVAQVQVLSEHRDFGRVQTQAQALFRRAQPLLRPFALSNVADDHAGA